MSLPVEVEAVEASSAEAKAKEDLIPSVWRHFPADLLEKVLTKLPVSVLKTFCRVCKQWKVLIESEAFALKCDSVESTLFAVHWSPHNRYISLPNLATDSWDRHDLEFSSGGYARLDFIAADQGLLLYQGLKLAPEGEVVTEDENSFKPESFLVVQNPVSFKWRRLDLPLKMEGVEVCYAYMSLLGGVQVDPGTGSFKVVVAYLDYHTRAPRERTFMTPREAFIYDSSSNSWTVSVAEAPLLFPRVRNDRPPYWVIETSICAGRDLYWLVQECDNVPDPTFKTLIKYNMTLDTWDMVTVEWPFWERRDTVAPLPNFALFQDQIFMAYLFYSKAKILLPPEFSDLAPEMEMFDVESAQRLLERVGNTFFDGEFKPIQAFAEGENWFLLSDAVVPGFMHTLLVSSSRFVMPLPRFRWESDADRTPIQPYLRFGTFPASWRLSHKLDRQLASM